MSVGSVLAVSMFMLLMAFAPSARILPNSIEPAQVQSCPLSNNSTNSSLPPAQVVPIQIRPISSPIEGNEIQADIGQSNIGLSFKNETINVTEYIHIDTLRFEVEANLGHRITLNLLNRGISFVLVRADLQSDVKLSPGEILQAEAYIGVDPLGINLVRVTMASDWIHISFQMNGTDYFIDPLWTINDKFPIDSYALYSSNDVRMTGAIDEEPTASVSDGTGIPLANNLSIMNNQTQVGMINTDASSSSVASSNNIGGTSNGLTFKEDKNNRTVSCKGGSDPDCRLARIVLAADSYTYTRYTNWPATALAALNDMAGRWEVQVGIAFKLATYINASEVNDQQRADVLSLLGNLSRYMGNHYPSLSRDVVVLCTIADLFYRGNNNNLGYALYYAGAASQKYYGDIRHYSAIEISHSSFENAYLMGHEIGHMFNGLHIYAEDTVNGKHTWEYVSYNGDSSMMMYFDQINRNRIKAIGNSSLDYSRLVNRGPSSLSSLYLQASNFLLDSNPFYRQVGSSMTVKFDLTSARTSDITLNYIFIGARDYSGNNRDYGYIYNVLIKAGETYHYSTTFTPSSSRTWTLWPAYNYGGGWGPYQWIILSPTMYYLISSSTGPTPDSNAGIAFYKHYLLAFVQTPHLNDVVTTYCTLFNAYEAGDYGTNRTDTFIVIFEICRCNNYIKDFGAAFYQSLSRSGPKTDGACGADIGGGYTIFASRTLDRTGSWSFGVCYQEPEPGGAWGPWLLTLTLSVS